ncbi:unnamed protein product [Moneuplotes crassus]|uniref:Ankyrin repeat protein n=2 Tax=Euplotes crassus TaxID=5936 RepID=A0AAD1XCC0_EUPCR|nr:unnamed protein product [Moneuplotes crassus]
MSEVQRPQRKNKNMTSLNELAAVLNEENIEDYIFARNPNNPPFDDVDVLRDYVNRTGTDLSELRGDIGETALFNCALIPDEDKALEMMKYMVEEQNILPETADDLSQTVMYYVAREGKIRCIEYLIKHGCSVDHIDIYRQSPLYYAVRDNKIEAARRLIELLGTNDEERRKKINHRDTENETVLFYAVNEGHFEMTKVLIELGADYNLENSSQKTVYDIVKNIGKNKNSTKAKDARYQNIELHLFSLGAKEGTKKTRGKKRSGRPANLATVKQYALCIFKNGKWVEATTEDEEALKLFHSIEKKKNSSEYIGNTVIPPNLPANLQWENAAIKIHDEMTKHITFMDSLLNGSVSSTPRGSPMKKRFSAKNSDSERMEENKEGDRGIEMIMYNIQEKLITNSYFSVEKWKNEMYKFLEANNSQSHVSPEGEKASNQLMKKFNELCEEHKMNLSLP